MRPERLAELEAYYSQNDDLYESHGAVLELIYAVRSQETELRAAREFREDVAAALAPGRWRGFAGPDGVSKDDVIEDVAAALKRYDP